VRESVGGRCVGESSRAGAPHPRTQVHAIPQTTELAKEASEVKKAADESALQPLPQLESAVEKDAAEDQLPEVCAPGGYARCVLGK
jgi:hypothetical protein